ncbi:cystathionine beta-lyase, partial [Pseudidiomarina aestuarii]
MKVYQNVLEMIGNTPMVKVSTIDTGPCELYLKMELMNPGGSIKDRIAVSMIEAAEREGKLKPGMTIIEATAGNTGLGLALVAASKGYPLKIVMPDKMSSEKVNNLRAMGAEVVQTRSDVQKGHPEYYQDMAARLAQEHGYFYVNHFANPANVAAHYNTTGPEIWEQMDGKLDAFVCGVGSGGTLSGIGRFLREKNSDVDLVLADPEGSILEPLVNRNETVDAGSWLVEGIGEDFIPDI